MMRIAAVSWVVMILVLGTAAAIGAAPAATKPAATQPATKPSGAIDPFNGKDLTGWRLKGRKEGTANWVVGTASLDPANDKEFTVAKEGKEMVNAKGRGVDLYSDFVYGDAVTEVEVMVPKGSNSGIYVMGEYEIQVLDSFGKEKVGPGDMGGLYAAASPKLNACKKPGEWQKFIIDFRAPRFDAEGKKIANARFVKITLNDKVIHENVEMKSQTPGGVTGKEHPTGPIMFQGDHGPVAFRNIKITPVKQQDR